MDLLDYCRSYRRIYCYGAGKYGKCLRIYFYCHGVDIDGFITTEKTESKDILRKKVYVLDEVDYSEDTAFILGVSPKYHSEMIHELNIRGYSNYIVPTISQLVSVVEDIRISNGWANLTDHLVCVLLYHRVNPYKNDYWRLSITPEMFANHMEILQDNFSIVRFGDDWDSVKSFSVAVTFDDGYADNFQYALPILEKYQIPATIFVSTGNIGTHKEFWWDKLSSVFLGNDKVPSIVNFDGITYEAASQEQRLELIKRIHSVIKDLSPRKREEFFQRMINEIGLQYIPNEENRSVSISELGVLGESLYVDIGAHTITHTALSMESLDEQLMEIQGSKEFLENLLGKKINVFSYPFGSETDFTNETVKLVKKCGFKKSATTVSATVGKDINPLCISRFRVPFYCDAEQLMKNLKRIFLCYV